VRACTQLVPVTATAFHSMHRSSSCSFRCANNSLSPVTFSANLKTCSTLVVPATLVPAHPYDSCYNPAHALGHTLLISSRISKSTTHWQALLRFGGRPCAIDCTAAGRTHTSSLSQTPIEALRLISVNLCDSDTALGYRHSPVQTSKEFRRHVLVRRLRSVAMSTNPLLM
jgi:hypothetical protein